jgi:invasion protein IalB
VKKPIDPIKMLRLCFSLTLGTAIFWSPSILHAQTKPAEQKPVDADPQSTSATYGDWVMRCNRVEINGQIQRLCEVAQTFLIQGQQVPVVELAIGRSKKTDPLHVTAKLPVNVAFPSAPRVYLDGKDTEALELPWSRCLPNGCFADATPKEDVIRSWRAARTAGRIETKDALGRNFVITISFRGLSQALDALNKEP